MLNNNGKTINESTGIKRLKNEISKNVNKTAHPLPKTKYSHKKKTTH